MGLVMIWFGLQQGQSPESWTKFLPSFTTSLPLSQITLIYLNAWMEICLGILLIFGFYTRIVAFILAVHLLGITFSVGYGPTGARDFGLTIALFAIFLHGESDWSLDNWFKAREETQVQSIS